MIESLDADPNNIYALNDKGLVLDRLNKHAEAITYYEKALAIDPNDTGTLSNKGLALDVTGKHEEAITYYEKALAIDPILLTYYTARVSP